MKKIIVLVICVLMFSLSGCQKETVNNFKVKYNYNDTNYSGIITITLDHHDEDKVNSIRIEINNEKEKLLDNSYYNSLNNQYLTNPPFVEGSKWSYLFEELDNGYNEYVEVYFNEDLQSMQMQDLLEHIGLKDEFSDGVLLYKDELLKSSSFKYSKILHFGESTIID